MRHIRLWTCHDVQVGKKENQSYDDEHTYNHPHADQHQIFGPRAYTLAPGSDVNLRLRRSGVVYHRWCRELQWW
jgi:hypothetical protein